MTVNANGPSTKPECDTTSTSPQQSASQTTTENARQQVDQILEQRKEGFSFESIAAFSA